MDKLLKEKIKNTILYNLWDGAKKNMREGIPDPISQSVGACTNFAKILLDLTISDDLMKSIKYTENQREDIALMYEDVLFVAKEMRIAGQVMINLPLDNELAAGMPGSISLTSQGFRDAGEMVKALKEAGFDPAKNQPKLEAEPVSETTSDESSSS